MRAKQIKCELIWDWMRPERATIEPQKTIDDAIDEMKRLNIHHLLVMKGKEFLGLLESRDCGGIWDKTTPVAEIMRRDVPIIDENSEVGGAVDLMLCHRLTALPLSRNNEIYGILTETDLLRLLQAYLTPVQELSDFVNRSKDILAKPVVQSLMSVLRNMGL